MTRPGKRNTRKAGIEPRSAALEAGPPGHYTNQVVGKGSYIVSYKEAAQMGAHVLFLL